MRGYDEWKFRTPPEYDYWDGEDEEGCTCPRTLAAGGMRAADEWCPVHGRDPDDERDARMERDDWRD